MNGKVKGEDLMKKKIQFRFHFIYKLLKGRKIIDCRFFKLLQKLVREKNS